jgi:hypothetical protein
MVGGLTVSPESKVERVLVSAVSRLGGVAYKFVSPSRRGVPDRLVVLPGGRIVFVEIKSSVGKLSPLQEIEIRRLRGLGARVEVVGSIEAVAEALA